MSEATKAFLAEPLGYLMSVALLGNPQDSAHRGGKAVGQARNQTEVDDTEPAILHELEVAGVRIGMQQADHARAREQESHVLQRGCIALLVGQVRSR